MAALAAWCDDAGRLIVESRAVGGSLEDAYFDLVYANFVVEHLDAPAAAIREWRRVLRPDGALILLTSNRANPVFAAASLLPRGLRVVAQDQVLAVGAVVCIAAAIAGATSQDLKTGFIVGATPVSRSVSMRATIASMWGASNVGAGGKAKGNPAVV